MVTEPSGFFSRRLTNMAAKTCLHLTPRVSKSGHSQVRKRDGWWWVPSQAGQGLYRVQIAKKFATMSASVQTTYPQEWAAYNEAQTNEKDKFQALLSDLCNGIP